MYDLGYLQELDHADLQTVFDNILPQFEASGNDPERKFMIPWQGGQTGIWVDTAKAPEIESVSDLFDPKYKGQVILLDELRDSLPLVLQSEDRSGRGDEGGVAGGDRQDRRGRRLGPDPGIHRQLLHRGPDCRQRRRLHWLVRDGSLIGREPSSGESRRCDTFFDQMVIPVGAPNTAAALEFMNFVYRPEVQVDITA